MFIYPRGSQLLPRVYEILVILASKYMGLMGDSRASVRDSALILASVADPSHIPFETNIYRVVVPPKFQTACLLQRMSLL